MATALPASARAKVFAHIERHLGPVLRGGNLRDGVTIVESELPSIRNTLAWSTLGLSDHLLDGPARKMRLELVMLARRDSELARVAASVLAGFTEMVLAAHRAPLRGETVACPVGDTPAALYVSAPSYLPVEFGVLDADDARVIFAWLIPITNEEADAIGRSGWSAFEDALAREDPDLLEIRTRSIAGIPGKRSP